MAMNANPIMNGPRAKVRRAYTHIDDLRRITVPLSREFYTIAVEDRVRPPYVIPDRVLMYRPTRDIAEEAALMIGDFLNNVRSALDYTASGIVRASTPGAKVYFPIRRTREDLATAPDLATMEAALPGSKHLLLDELRPDGGPNEAVWAFAGINNQDKHNLLVPTVAATRVTGLNLTWGTNIMGDMELAFDATRPSSLIATRGPVAIQNNFQTAVELRFGPGNPFENELVIPTLSRVAEVVTETLDAFERLIKSA